MRHSRPLSILLVLALSSISWAGGVDRDALRKINAKLAGTVVDYTDNHGVDNRIYSAALQERRDLYVYLPPHYDPSRQYPLLIMLHGYLQDEGIFLREVVKPLDQAITCGNLPPLILAAPDGTLNGRCNRQQAGSFFINSRAGRYADYIVDDIWNFMTSTYSIRPEREAHIIAGASMGGFGAYNIALKHRDRFKIVIGILPALNARWVDLEGHYMSDFDPNNWGWREYYDHHEEIHRLHRGSLMTMWLYRIVQPVFGVGQEAIINASRENPIELVERTNLQQGELDMYVGYGVLDELNLDAQAESFIYLVRSRGIDITVKAVAGGHSEKSARLMMPDMIHWLNERLRAYHVDVPRAR